jgi:hypothetical protein
MIMADMTFDNETIRKSLIKRVRRVELR